MIDRYRIGSGKALRIGQGLICLFVLVVVGRCAAGPDPITMKVTATAYNSLPEQTNSMPSIAAWGDKLVPGMKVIAVSNDLLREGLSYGTEVQIKGLEGHYVVLDKMNSRWERKIDIYMGEDVEAALQWGVREVEISWILAEKD